MWRYISVTWWHLPLRDDVYLSHDDIYPSWWHPSLRDDLYLYHDDVYPFVTMCDDVYPYMMMYTCHITTSIHMWSCLSVTWWHLFLHDVYQSRDYVYPSYRHLHLREDVHPYVTMCVRTWWCISVSWWSLSLCNAVYLSCDDFYPYMTLYISHMMAYIPLEGIYPYVKMSIPMWQCISFPRWFLVSWIYPEHLPRMSTIAWVLNTFNKFVLQFFFNLSLSYRGYLQPAILGTKPAEVGNELMCKAKNTFLQAVQILGFSKTGCSKDNSVQLDPVVGM